MNQKPLFYLTALLSLLLIGCSRSIEGPDKTIGGAVLGAGWGAGAGAVVGNQSGDPGPGAAIGAGFGAVEGAVSGFSADQTEDQLIAQERQLDALEAQNVVNSRNLMRLQAKLDQSFDDQNIGGIYQVFFDSDATSLRAGAIANLEAITETLKVNPRAHHIVVSGHTDDSGSPDYNSRVAQARARAVSAYLASRGISSDQIIVKSYGSERPIASNSTEVGRQLNRRVDVHITQ